MSELDVLVDEIVFLFDILEIAPDFRRVGVIMGPGSDMPGKLVVDTRHVAGTARVAVLSRKYGMVRSMHIVMPLPPTKFHQYHYSSRRR